MDASLGPGFRSKGKRQKTGWNSKKKKKQQSASEATISFSQTTARLDPLVFLSFYALLSPLRGRVPGYVDAHDGLWFLSEKTPDGVTNRTSQSKGSIFPQLYHSLVEETG